MMPEAERTEFGCSLRERWSIEDSCDSGNWERGFKGRGRRGGADSEDGA